MSSIYAMSSEEKFTKLQSHLIDILRRNDSYASPTQVLLNTYAAIHSNPSQFILRAIFNQDQEYHVEYVLWKIKWMYSHNSPVALIRNTGRSIVFECFLQGSTDASMKFYGDDECLLVNSCMFLDLPTLLRKKETLADISPINCQVVCIYYQNAVSKFPRLVFRTNTASDQEKLKKIYSDVRLFYKSHCSKILCSNWIYPFTRASCLIGLLFVIAVVGCYCLVTNNPS